MEADMPRPTAAHARLGFFEGTWSGEESIYPSPLDPAGSTRTGRFECRLLEGFFLIADYTQRQEGEVCFRGHGVYGYDPAGERYTMHWFDSMGIDPAAPVPGSWAGNHLVFQHQSAQGFVRYAYTTEGEDAFTFAMSLSQDGSTWQPLMKGSYRKT